eukprot:scaffold983_cov96-Skeletonema_dohrnii-CCMP3373.AAC.5
MTGNHWWKVESAGVRVWKAGTSSLPRRRYQCCRYECIMKEDEMEHWWAFRPVEQNKTSDMSQRDKQ